MQKTGQIHIHTHLSGLSVNDRVVSIDPGLKWSSR